MVSIVARRGSTEAHDRGNVVDGLTNRAIFGRIKVVRDYDFGRRGLVGGSSANHDARAGRAGSRGSGARTTNDTNLNLQTTPGQPGELWIWDLAALGHFRL